MTTQTPPTDKPSNCLYDIPYLNDDGLNYQAWKYHVQTVLELQRLWKAVEGIEPDQDKSWDTCTQIILTLKDELLNVIIGIESAKDIWDKLSI